MEGDANLELFANFRCWQVNGRQSYSTKDLLAFMRLFVFNPQEEQDSFFLRELELNLKTRLENAEYFTV